MLLSCAHFFATPTTYFCPFVICTKNTKISPVKILLSCKFIFWPFFLVAGREHIQGESHCLFCGFAVVGGSAHFPDCALLPSKNADEGEG